MKLSRRDLFVNLSGADVSLLQRELRQLGLAIPDDEARRSFFGPGTERAVREFQRGKALGPTGVVDGRTAAAINAEVAARRPRVVRGTVTDGGGAPQAGMVVRAFDRDLRREEALAQATTGRDGSYEIQYVARQFRRAEKTSADLVVRLLGRGGRALLSSDIIFNSGAVETVDFVLDGPAAGAVSEYERHAAELRPLLEEVAVAALDERDIDFLAGETGIERLHLAYMAVAHRHGAATGVRPEAFYGLFRQELPTGLPALLLQPPARLRRALELSVGQGIVPAGLRDELPRVLEALSRQAGRAVLRGAEGAPATVPRLLAAAGLSGEEQEAFLDARLRHEGDAEEFWRALEATPLAGKVGRLRATLQLGMFTRDNAPLVEALRAEGVRSVRDLPRLGREGLRRLILGSGEILAAIPAEEGETDERRAERVAEGMLEALRAAAPTAFVRALYEGADDGVRRGVARVLENSPELELRDDDVDRFLSDHPRSLDGVADPEPVRRHLKRVQRVLRVAPDAQHAEVLMEAGLDSAQAVARMAPEAFEEQFAERLGGAEQSRAYHRRAGRMTDAVAGLVAAVAQAAHDVRPGVVGPLPRVVRELPNFTTLFGPQGFCSCEHCASVLSPAAYLVDLLRFIDPPGGPRPVAELRRRRPDIEHIPLTCENTNTPLPYVDLVNEILEFYVANGELTEEAARDTGLMTAAELNVTPEHVIGEAYAALAEAVYPPPLPFQRPLATARLYLERLGSSRHELMEAFRRGGQPSEADADLEYLKLSAFERDILTGDAGRPLAAFYGLPASQNPAGRDEIKVSEFLRLAGVTYEDLLALLGTRFLNPDEEIRAEDDENPPRCDLARTTLTNLTPDFWRRAHRFIRLRRGLGWEARDLDRAFAALQETDITPEFLRKLAAVEKLRARLALPVPVLLSFWGDLDTEGIDSTYAGLFLSRAVRNPPERAFRVFELEGSEELLAAHAATVLAALRVSASDLNALAQSLGLTAQTTLSLPLLSALHRHVALARALRLGVRDYLSLVSMSGVNPFEQAEPSASLRFAELARLLKESGFGVAQLRYLYLSETPNPSAPTEASVRALFDELRGGLRRVTEMLPRPVEAASEEQRAGLMSEALKAVLPLVLKDDAAARGAEDVLAKPALDDADMAFVALHFTFLEAEEAAALALDPTPEARRARVLAAAVAHMRRDFVLQTLGEDLRVGGGVAAALAGRVLVSQGVPGRMALADFLRIAELPDGAPGDPWDEAPEEVVAFRSSYLRLHKAALLARGFRLTGRELVYLQLHPQDFGVDFNSLPLAPEEFDAAQFRQWERLARYAALARGVPQRDASLVDVFEAASRAAPDDARAEAVRLLKLATGWDAEELDYLAGPEGFDLAAEDFRNEERLAPLRRALRLAARLGVSSARLFRWAEAEVGDGVADEVVSAAKAAHTDEQWPAFAKPLNDALRESRREALVAYTLDRAGLAGADQLFERFLIDAGMGACMKTSRIKQAISSVQLFIQRCLMNLEPAVSPSSVDAEQWEWMKNYRVWEANRKVFLHPENWIEPELRDDKSPIFRELEAELLQGDLDAATAERAFLHYLEGLDRVARLEPCGLYVQAAAAGGGEEVVHVFGRTTEEPREYFYRRLVNGRTWTPWEPVGLDIEGDHLMPVVHDRRLYLFWLRFEQKQNEKQQFPHGFISSEEHYEWLDRHRTWREEHGLWQEAQDIWKALESLYRSVNRQTDINIDIEQEKVSFGESNEWFVRDEPKEPTEPAFSNPPPIVHWQVRLCWGEYQWGRWTAKRTSAESLISPMRTWLLADFAADIGMLSDDEEYEAFKAELEATSLTVAAAYLPPEESHFVVTGEDSGGLFFKVFRRFAATLPVLDATMTTGGASYLGRFNLHCGTKVQAVRKMRETDFKYSSIEEVPYEELEWPWRFTNHALAARNQLDPQPLEFAGADGRERVILGRPMAGGYTMLYEHAQPWHRLTPPFCDFFFHDRDKTYYARYQTAAAGLLARPALSALGGSFRRHADLVTSFNRRLPPPSDGQGGDGRGKVVVRSRRAAEPAVLGVTAEASAGARELAEDTSAARAAARAGLALNTKEARRVVGAGFDAAAFGEMFQTGLRFHTFFHPHVCAFTERLYRGGVEGLLALSTQQLQNESSPGDIFRARYAPTAEVARPHPREHVDFGGGAYSLYNWELFFHIPMLVAVSLARNQRFADALRWFHFIFDPTTAGGADSPRRYWKTLPFFNNSDPEKDQIAELLLTLAERRPGWKEVEDQIAEWLDNPFNPHLIARMRITAYQKNVVMKYVDTLIAWGDQLFARDTLESINEATLLYVLAADILGPRPEGVAEGQPGARTYADLRRDLDAFGNALVEAENAVPNLTQLPEPSWEATARARRLATGPRAAARGPASAAGPAAGAGSTQAPGFSSRPSASLKPSLSAVRSPYFCVPRNEQMLRCWDTVADRLFKIRHCMNLEGAVRELPLFEPPIDPALLVRAAAAGLDISSALSDLYAPLPHYRFGFMLQKAQELCGELKSLGGALLSALEKRDAEALSSLRAAHETSLLKAAREVRRQQVAEAGANLEALDRTLESARHRRNHYESLREQGLIAEEKEHSDKTRESHAWQGGAQRFYLMAQHLSGIPDFNAGVSGWSSPVATFTLGGTNLSHAVTSFAKFMENQAAGARAQAEMSSIEAGHRRRAEEWDFQAASAQKEIDQISRQMAAARIRQAVAEKELENHDRQIEQSEAVAEFLRGKYTGEELYGWMSAQVSKVYFQTYRLASDLAKRAERAYRYELGLRESDFVRPGQWDTLRKGLLAGEQLSLDLKRMEAAYVEQNRREYEITKHVSLLLHDPLALLRLKQTGRCGFTLPEALFDLDYPGHYMRRLKSVGLSVPCVTGPYTSVNCTLTLVGDRTRVTNMAGAGEEGVARNFAARQSIATSHAQNDAGVFELSFRDERYLPFEGAGADSDWEVELPAQNNAFDFDTITDVVLHLKYTARDGGAALRAEAEQRVNEQLAADQPGGQGGGEPLTLARFFSLRNEFPTEWHRFLHRPEPGAGEGRVHRITLDLRERFPYLFKRRGVRVHTLHLFLRLKDGYAYDDADALGFGLFGADPPPQAEPNFEALLTQAPARFRLTGSEFPGVPYVRPDLSTNSVPPVLALEVPESETPSVGAGPGAEPTRLIPEAVEDIWLLCEYVSADGGAFG